MMARLGYLPLFAVLLGCCLPVEARRHQPDPAELVYRQALARLYQHVEATEFVVYQRLAQLVPVLDRMVARGQREQAGQLASVQLRALLGFCDTQAETLARQAAHSVALLMEMGADDLAADITEQYVSLLLPAVQTLRSTSRQVLEPYLVLIAP